MIFHICAVQVTVAGSVNQALIQMDEILVLLTFKLSLIHKLT